MYKAPDIPCCALQRIPRIHFHNLSVSLISAPQQVSEIYTTVCPFNFTHFIVNLREKEDYSWFICDFNSHFFFLLFFFFLSTDCFCGSVWVPDDPDLKSLFSCCHGSTLTLLHLKCEASCTALSLKKPLQLSLLEVE